MKKLTKKQSKDMEKEEEKIIESIKYEDKWEILKGQKVEKVLSILDQAVQEPLYLRKAAINKTHST